MTKLTSDKSNQWPRIRSSGGGAMPIPGVNLTVSACASGLGWMRRPGAAVHYRFMVSHWSDGHKMATRPPCRRVASLQTAYRPSRVANGPSWADRLDDPKPQTPLNGVES